MKTLDKITFTFVIVSMTMTVIIIINAIRKKDINDIISWATVLMWQTIFLIST